MTSPELTLRQRQIAGLVAMGMTNREIAGKLHLSEGTVKEYLGRLYQKLKLPNRTALAIWAIAPGALK